MAVAAVWLWTRAQERSLGPSAFSTGYLLLAAVLFLALYNVRKKLPFLPLGSSAAWLQWHLYVGIGSVGVFALHAGIRWPTGVLNSALAVVYLATVASGLLGLYLTRTIPRQLARVGEEVIYERIPALQHASSNAGGRRGARIGHRIGRDDAGRFLRRAAVRFLSSVARGTVFHSADDGSAAFADARAAQTFAGICRITSRRLASGCSRLCGGRMIWISTRRGNGC